MDKRWKNLGILAVVLIVVLLAFYFFVFSSKSDINSEIGLIWANQGVDINKFDMVYYLNEEGLIKVKNSILDLKLKNMPLNQDQLNSIESNIMLVDLLSELIKEENSNDKLDLLGVEEYCSNIVLFDQRNEISSNIVFLSQKLYERASAFESTKWISNHISVIELENDLQFKNATLTKLKVGCLND